MRKGLILVLVLALGVSIGALGNRVLAQPAVSPIAPESKGLHSTLKFEQVVSGHLKDVNGKYKLRVGEVTLILAATSPNTSTEDQEYVLSLPAR